MENDLLYLLTETHSVAAGLLLPPQFRKISELLMLRHAMQVNKDIYEFVEVGFYYKNNQTHVDQNTHAKEGQKTCGELNFTVLALISPLVTRQ